MKSRKLHEALESIRQSHPPVHKALDFITDVMFAQDKKIKAMNNDIKSLYELNRLRGGR
ncbi:hypothetical protein KAR91_17785 [Candidatus Pacearchaeota archaeon]|nr:hypothetical protein [Candidatus Pacearchaeota archaeon]